MAWRTILALSLVSTAVATIGCSSSTGNGTDGGTQGVTGTGGGTATGGGGGTDAGGGTATGGSGASCTISNASTDACAGCIATNCMDEYCACTGTCFTEYMCIDTCLKNGFQNLDGGSMDLATCASQCAQDGSQVSNDTDALVSCIDEQSDSGTEACSTQCFGFTLNSN